MLLCAWDDQWSDLVDASNEMSYFVILNAHFLVSSNAMASSVSSNIFASLCGKDCAKR